MHLCSLTNTGQNTHFHICLCLSPGQLLIHSFVLYISQQQSILFSQLMVVGGVLNLPTQVSLFICCHNKNTHTKAMEREKQRNPFPCEKSIYKTIMCRNITNITSWKANCNVTKYTASTLIMWYNVNKSYISTFSLLYNGMKYC